MFEDENGRRVIRLGDTTDHGGKVITGAEMWDVFGRPIARIGDKVICPRCDNQVYEIIEGNQKITAFGRPVAFEGHKTSCGATLISSLGQGSRSSGSSFSSQSNSYGSNATAHDGSSSGINSVSASNEAKPSDLLELDKRAILMRYREAMNYMNKYGLRFQGFAPDSMIGYGLADVLWNGLRNNDYFPGMFTGGKYYRCRPQSEVVIDWLYDLDLNYEWVFNFAVSESVITGNESHTWVEAKSPIGSTVIHMDPLWDKVTFPMQPHPYDYISATEVSNLFINRYRDYKIAGFQWEYKEDRFQSGQKLRERRIAG